jgi:hypothetical protein
VQVVVGKAAGDCCGSVRLPSKPNGPGDKLGLFVYTMRCDFEYRV